MIGCSRTSSCILAWVNSMSTLFSKEATELERGLPVKNDIFPFEPMGRKMREWIYIIHDKSDDYLKDIHIFEESIEFVSSIAGLNLKKGN